jgi:hypothetical protein
MYLRFFGIFQILILFLLMGCNPMGGDSQVDESYGVSKPTLSFSSNPLVTGSVGSQMKVTPTGTKNYDTCTVSPPLPYWLSIDNSTCEISGIPYDILPQTVYQLTAQNEAGSVTASVTLASDLTCPSDFVAVHANTSLNVYAFCVSKYEMKCSGSSCSDVSSVGPSATAQAVSQKEGLPWVRITQSNALVACSNLGDKYGLVSNPEWMTIAYELESKDENWTSGAKGTGMLFKGHSDGLKLSGAPNTHSSLEAALDSDPYYLTGNNASEASGFGKEQKRTHTLKSGDILWDFSGNVWEWSNWELDELLTSGPSNCPVGPTELEDVSCGTLFDKDFLPANPLSRDPYNSTYGLGLFLGGSGGALSRGGISSGGINTGIFSLDLGHLSNHQSVVIGFRCVYRPVN